jgi:hypothetical protein
MWESILTGTVSGVSAAVVFAIIMRLWHKLQDTRLPEIRHAPNGNHFHWRECNRFPMQGWVEGKGDKEPCDQCEMIEHLEREPWSMFQRSLSWRIWKKRLPPDQE